MLCFSFHVASFAQFNIYKDNMSKKPLLILMRHGQSAWNKKNVFTGWVDVPLCQEGIVEAENAGKLLSNTPIDIVYTSTLIRAISTATIALNFHHSKKTAVIIHPSTNKMGEWTTIHDEKTAQETIPIYMAWQLNERMYGDLQGLNKAATMEKFGKEQVQIWRRSFDIAPPGGESLAMTAARTLPFFNDVIMPLLAEGKNVFISAHGNSLRSIIMQLDGLSKEEVVALELPTGEPIFYEYSEGILRKS
jgi:2,3-bisphosphoglycerate-dependent phosphoglycerate mutase